MTLSVMSADAAINMIAERLQSGLETFGVPGAAAGIFVDGREGIITAGTTSVEHPLPVDEDTLFQIGSTTKTLTATVVMRLVERDLLDLDEPVHAYVPELELADADVTRRVTLRHLLTHMGGHDGDLFDDFGRGDDALGRACSGMHVLPQLAPLGEVWSYSNAGFSIAGRAIEAVTGTTFEQACADLVLTPLGMTRSVFFAEEAITHRVAIGHHSSEVGPAVTRPWALSRAVNPAGGLVASIRDQMTYARFHLGDGRSADGTRLLDDATMRSMLSPQAEAGGGRAAAVGLSWLLQQTPGVIAHGGDTNGQSSAFVIVPDRQFAIAVATNADSGSALHTGIVKWALREVCGVEPARPRIKPAPPTLPPQVCGRFVSRLEELTVDLLPDGMLTVELAPTPLALAAFPDSPTTAPAAAELYDNGAVRVVDGPLAGARGEFLRDADGGYCWFRIFGRIHVRIDGRDG